MKSETIEITGNRNNGERIKALLIEDPDDNYIEATDKLWWVYRQRFINALRAAQKPVPGHHHWNWKWKLQQEMNRNAFFKCFGIVCGGDPQGLLLLNYGREYKSRLPEQQGRPLVYLAYVESAPWNIREYCGVPRYTGVGREFFKATVRFSNRLGCEGRVGLHSLPGVENFYAESCKMIPVGSDPSYENLVYFETRPDIY